MAPLLDVIDNMEWREGERRWRRTGKPSTPIGPHLEADVSLVACPALRRGQQEVLLSGAGLIPAQDNKFMRDAAKEVRKDHIKEFDSVC